LSLFRYKVAVEEQVNRTDPKKAETARGEKFKVSISPLKSEERNPGSSEKK
jgi:hypothetical protein